MGRRISVVGNSGAGKTRLAARIAVGLDLPHLELDALHHRPNWNEAPPAEFRATVAAFIDHAERANDGWVIDGNYRGQLADLVTGRADTVVWLDYSRALVLKRVLLRSAGRLVLRRRLWHGNRELWSSMLSRDPNRNIALWSWTRHRVVRATFERESVTGAGNWVRLQSPAETALWLATLVDDEV